MDNRIKVSEIEQEWKENTRLDGRIEEKRSKDGFDFHFGGNLAAKSGSDKAESRTKNGVGARFECTGRSFARVRKPDSYPFKISHRSRLLNRSY